MNTLIGRILGSGLAGIAMIFSLATNAAEASHDEVVAVWKPQRVVFDYRSEGRHYSCGTLAYKIKMILEHLGADDRLELRRFYCRDLASLSRFEVVMQSPVEATEENVRAITAYDSKDHLVARLHGIEMPSAGEIETFPAVWASISFRRLDLDARDCALVQQLRRQVLPQMSVQITKDIRGVDCAQELTGRAPRLTVLALVPREGRDAASVHDRPTP